eukprot:COSAG04_NODE_4214_length_2228_cov_1.149366_1_plen_115_part_10
MWPQYAIFDWDNIFGSMLAGLGNKSWAYSNLIRECGNGRLGHDCSDGRPLLRTEVIKSKTAAGFVPNFAAGGSKSMDRTEPPVGSKTLHDLYKKYQDKWIVELLFDDLLDWSNWQ